MSDEVNETVEIEIVISISFIHIKKKQAEWITSFLKPLDNFKIISHDKISCEMVITESSYKYIYHLFFVSNQSDCDFVLLFCNSNPMLIGKYINLSERYPNLLFLMESENPLCPLIKNSYFTAEEITLERLILLIVQTLYPTISLDKIFTIAEFEEKLFRRMKRIQRFERDLASFVFSMKEIEACLEEIDEADLVSNVQISLNI